MASSYTYIGDEERYYPDQGVHATKGTTASFDAKPDENWAVSSTKKAAAVTDEQPQDKPAATTTTTKA